MHPIDAGDPDEQRDQEITQVRTKEIRLRFMFVYQISNMWLLSQQVMQTICAMKIF